MLKAGIREAATILRTGAVADPSLAEDKVNEFLAKAGKGHSLERLVQRLEDLLGRLGLERLPAKIHEVLQALHQLDPGGDAFRYASVRDKQTNQYVPAPRPAATHVDVVAMQHQFDAAFNLLHDGVLSVLGEHGQMQADQQHDSK